MVSAAPTVDLVKDLYPFCPERQKPWAQREKKKSICRISQQLWTAEMFQYGPGRSNPIILFCPNSTVFSIIIILLCHWNAGVFQNIEAYLPSCWNDSTGGKGYLFFFFGDESIIGKKNQDTNSQFWCFPDLLEALVSSTRIRNTDIYIKRVRLLLLELILVPSSDSGLCSKYSTKYCF